LEEGGYGCFVGGGGHCFELVVRSVLAGREEYLLLGGMRGFVRCGRGYNVVEVKDSSTIELLADIVI